MDGNETKIIDFYEAVILKSLDVPLKRIEKVKSSTASFIFAISPKESQELLLMYWNRETHFEGRLFVENINELKTRLYSTLAQY